MANFLSITPRADWYLNWNSQGIPLKVIADDAVDYDPNININVADLNEGYKHFHNQGTRGGSFKINIFVGEEDVVDSGPELFESAQHAIDTITTILNMGFDGNKFGLEVPKALDIVIRNMIPVVVVSESADIKDDVYIITENDSRKQTHRGGSIWSLTFTLFDEFQYKSFKSVNKTVKSALKKYQKKQKTAKKKAQQKKEQAVKTTAKWKLQHKCKASQLKYTTNQKPVACVKYMQKILYNKGCLEKLSQVDGWYGKVTVAGVKKFQRKYKKKYKLKETGKVDNATFKALYTA